MKKQILFILLFSLFSFTHAQKEAANWYFGRNAGLDFNSGTPAPLTNGALSTTEGCSTISDFNGNLLFYTDGITVWNRVHQIMPNGNGLGGHPSSSQSGIVVPYPGNPDLYYIFTVDEKGDPDGLQYNIVDMTINGGFGDIISKNNVLHTPVTEKVTAVAHTNGSDIWVISHEYGSDKFLAYLVTATGLNTTPVVSSVGFNFPILNNGRGSRGYLKASPNGAYLASAGSAALTAEVFRFNPVTGNVSDLIDLSPYFSTNLVAPYTIYGVEFSPDSSRLYFSTSIMHSVTSIESNIHQFNLSNYNESDILNSGIPLGPSQPVEIGALQLAIDGKIYVAQFTESYLGVINNPNIAGLGSDYVQIGVNLSGRSSSLGLPPFIQSYFIVGILANNFCLGDTTEFSVTADSNNPITSISWDFGDGNSSALENPAHQYNLPGIYTVTVQVTTATDTKTETKEVTIYNTPTAIMPTNYEVCVTTATLEFDLSTKDSEILGAQSASEFSVNYYPTFLDAQNGTNLLPDQYTNSNATETIFARVFNRNNPACFDITSFGLQLNLTPHLNVITGWTVCDTDMDGFYNFNLSEKTNEILDGNDASLLSVSYYTSQADADSRNNPVAINYTNTQPITNLYFRIENNNVTSCYESGSFTLEVILGVTANAPSDFEVCDTDNDGFFEFDLTTKEAEILGSQNAASVNISFHESELEAENNVNPISKTAYENTRANQQTIYVRLENTSATSCYDTTEFDLIVYDTPALTSVSNWVICDDNNDGIQSFDLHENDIEILGNQPTTDFLISYYTSNAEAITNINPITGLFQNSSNPQTIWYRIENRTNPECYVTSDFELQVFETPEVNTLTTLIVCAVNETGIQTFDLTQKDSEVLNGQSNALYEVFYFANEADANANINQLTENTYSNTNLEETIYVRIQNRQLTSCYDIGSFELKVNELPDPGLDEFYVICLDSPDLMINGGVFESWLWLDEDNNVLGVNQFLEVNTLGNYSLTVENLSNGIVCEKTVSFEVLSSGAPEDFTTEILNFSDLIIIEVDVLGEGNFEYSVDGVNFQSNNRIEVFPGIYTVYVRDTLACRTITKEVIAVGFQKFFTPNSDGINDFWNIIGAEYFPNSKIYIFDRQGKLLAQLEPTAKGWDGTFRGFMMPSTDYWFRFENEDGLTYTGHFSLKR